MSASRFPEDPESLARLTGPVSAECVQEVALLALKLCQQPEYSIGDELDYGTSHALSYTTLDGSQVGLAMTSQTLLIEDDQFLPVERLDFNRRASLYSSTTYRFERSPFRICGRSAYKLDSLRHSYLMIHPQTEAKRPLFPDSVVDNMPTATKHDRYARHQVQREIDDLHALAGTAVFNGNRHDRLLAILNQFNGAKLVVKGEQAKARISAIQV